jgi:predicted XRE-type DNA-binding protein
MKTIPNFPNYAVDKRGSVFSLPHYDSLGRFWSGKKLKQSPASNGYMCISTYIEGKRKTSFIHQLVLETFVGPCPEGMEACHNNGIRRDNRLENLRWDTTVKNVSDSIKHGTHRSLHQMGEKNKSSKLTSQDVRIIIYTYRTKLFSQREIGKQFGISQQQISKIINGKRWQHII